MRLLNINGKLQSKKVSKYLIKWSGKSCSKIQFRTKQFLKPFWKNQIVYEEFPVYGTKMRVDILNATNKFFHGGSRLKYLESIKRDVAKANWLESNNFTLIEIEEDEIDSLSIEFFKKNFNLVL